MFWNNKKKTQKHEVKLLIVAAIKKEVLRLESIRQSKPQYAIEDYTVQCDFEVEEIFNLAYQMGRDKR